MVSGRRRLSLPTLEVLAVMLENPAEEYYGLALRDRVGRPTGTIYPLLRRLEQAGWLSSREEDIDPTEQGRPRRRLYRLTGEGAVAARAELRHLQRSPVFRLPVHVPGRTPGVSPA